MKKSLLFMFAFAFCHSRYCAQSYYVPVPLKDCYWLNSGNSFCAAGMSTNFGNSSYLEKFYPDGDTVINNKRYVKFYLQNISCNYSTGACSPFQFACPNSYWGCFRQDTLGKKLFYIIPTSTVEAIAFDFNYSVNDTIKTGFVSSFQSSPRIVESVYYQSYNDGVCRKTFKLKPLPTSIYTPINYLIEGLGTEVGLINSINSVVQGSPGAINYMTINWSSQPVVNNFSVNAVSSNTCTQGIRESLNSSDNFHIFPTLFKDELFIVSETNNADFSVEIFSVYGNMVYAEKIKNPNRVKLNPESLSKGVYYLIVRQNEKITRQKVIKE